MHIYGHKYMHMCIFMFVHDCFFFNAVAGPTLKKRLKFQWVLPATN